MIIIYILLGIAILSVLRIFGIVKKIVIELQNISPKIHFIYEQLLKEKGKITEAENKLTKV